VVVRVDAADRLVVAVLGPPHHATRDVVALVGDVEEAGATEHVAVVDGPGLDDLVGFAGVGDALEVAAEVRRLEQRDPVVVVHPGGRGFLAAAEEHRPAVDEHAPDVREVVTGVDSSPGVAGVGRPPETALAGGVPEAEVLQVVVEVARGGEPDVLGDGQHLVDVVDDGVPAVSPGLAAAVAEAAAADLGQHALQDPDLDALLATATELVADTLDTDYCKVLDLDHDAEELLLRQGVGWDDGLVGEATVSAVEDDSQAAFTLSTEAPVIVEDLAVDDRFDGPDLLTDHGLRSGITTIVGPADDPWGVLGIHDTDRRAFTAQDATFVQAVANVLAAAIERHGYGQELVRQREQLDALNSLNEVVRDIASAVVEQSTRAEIERTVCERLAATDSYQFAWTGEVDTASQRVEPRAQAGVEGYLEGVTLSVDPDDERSEGATGRALRTGEVQVTNDIVADDRYDPWRESVEAYGFRSSAAVPIVHEGTTYGVLNVYTERESAFVGQERVVIAQIGEVVGHAIAATERKRALMSDELVELEFQTEDVFRALDAPTRTDERITLDHAVPVGDGEFLAYGTAEPAAMDTVRGLVSTLPRWESVTERGDGDPVSFELRLTDPPVLSAVASVGGYVESAVVEGGDLRLTVHLAPTVEARQVIDAVEAAYPGTEMLRRRQITREHDDPQPLPRQLLGDLTDRQQAALEAAYYAGFFEWPRETSGEEVAESLGVSPPTFHQHLRKAERKLFETLLTGPVGEPERPTDEAP
jgi:GAF domain-containing protein